MSLNSFNAPRLTYAYMKMTEKARYRPAAPGDGLGNILLDDDELADVGRLCREATQYAHRFAKQDDSQDWIIGCSNGSTLVAFVYVIEAARCLCGGSHMNIVAERLLKLALAELKTPTQLADNEQSNSIHRWATDALKAKEQA